jgi:alkylhydroperoxidase family enzyme
LKLLAGPPPTGVPQHTAPAASQPVLDQVSKAFGFVPNLQANMAESPELLAGYTALWDLVAKSSLAPHEQQVVYLTANFEHNCHYCMAATLRWPR